jgi:hypothetical protein
MRNARLRLIELEIESHRVKAELARLEAVREDEVADRLSRLLPEVIETGISPASWKRLVPNATFDEPVVERTGRPPAERATANEPAIQSVDASTHAVPPKQRPRQYLESLRRAPALVLSLLFHFALFVLFGFFTFATLQTESFPLMASAIDDAETVVDEPVDIEIEQPEITENELEEIAFNTNDMSIDTQSLSDQLDPAERVGSELGADFGFVDTLPGDVGTLMAGPGGGEPGGGGRVGASFFGARSEGNRFVFVLDNSPSMKRGRLETALLEMLRSVDAMSAKQFFYVIFVSDQPYPMFYPEPVRALLPATRDNKARLRKWLQTVEICAGSTKQLVPALELAAALRPDTVYFLWDGGIPATSRYLQPVMSALTEGNQQGFALHTLGMGVTTASEAERLAAIAAAHGGTYRPVLVNENITQTWPFLIKDDRAPNKAWKPGGR